MKGMKRHEGALVTERGNHGVRGIHGLGVGGLGILLVAGEVCCLRSVV